MGTREQKLTRPQPSIHIEGESMLSVCWSDANMNKSLACPCHSRDPQVLGVKESQGRGLGPMDRFMAEGPAEQYAVLNRPDNGKLSIRKECICKKKILKPKV